MRNYRLHAKLQDYDIPNADFVYYIVWLGKNIDVRTSRFKVTKTLKINEMVHFTYKYRKDD